MSKTDEKASHWSPSGYRPPGQARAKETVEAILTAGRMLLEEDGAFSTSHIAARAGVSIGSLYQYFVDKEVIAAKLYESYLDDFYEQLTRIAQSRVAASPNEVIADIVREVFRLQRTKTSFRRKLKGMLPAATIEAILAQSFALKLQILMQALVSRLSPQKAPKEQETLSFLLTTLLPHLVHETFAKHPEFFSDAAYERQINRLIRALFASD